MERILVGLLVLVCNVACGQQMICGSGGCRLVQPFQPVRGLVKALGSIGPDVVIRNDVTFSPTIVEQAPVVIQAPVVQCPEPVSIVETAPVCGCGCNRVGCGCGNSMQANIGYGGGSRYDVAMRSARYRASRGIKGHCSIEMGFTAGVGWSSFDSFPATCLGRGGANYAVVRGRDGWYATKIR